MPAVGVDGDVRDAEDRDDEFMLAGIAKRVTDPAEVIAVNPETKRVTVQGVNLVKKHRRESQTAAGRKVEGGVITVEAPIHVSNVQLVVKVDGKEVVTFVAGTQVGDATVSATVNVTVDLTGPAVAILEPAPDAATPRDTIRLRGVLDALSMIPLAVPGLVMAFGFLAVSSWLSNWKVFAGADWWPRLVDVRTNPTLFLVLAYSVRRLPYMVRSAVAGLQQTSVTFEEAAWNLGASPARTLRRITLPLILANLIAGTMLTFAFSMLEVSDSLMLAQQADYMPITKAIFELFQLLGTGKYVAAALGVAVDDLEGRADGPGPGCGGEPHQVAGRRRRDL